MRAFSVPLALPWVLVVIAAGGLSCSSSGSATGPGKAEENVPPAPAPTGSEPPRGPRGPGGEPATPSGPASVLYVGRFDTTDPAGPKAAWPGARVLTRFEGTAVSVTLSEFAEPWMEGAPSYWEVTIDHGPWTPIAMLANAGPHVFDLAKDLPPGEHVVEIYKRSETQTGITQFLGFDFHGGKALPAPARQKRHIETMGDSQSTGFGVEKIDAPLTECPGADHGGVYQNYRKAWGGVLGTMFDAEVHAIVYSGKGLIQNIWPTDNDPLRDYYPRANPNPAIAHSAPLFDLTSWIPDVVVLMQGAIDFNTGVSYGAFRDAYRDFVINKLRARGPDTHIIMGVLGKGGREAIPEIGQAIIAERAAVGDHRLYTFVAKLYTWEEVTGCNGHGTPAYHQRVANEIAELIRAKVGWE